MRRPGMPLESEQAAIGGRSMEGAGVTLTDEERAEALAVLEDAGIVGSDATSSLEQVERASADLPLERLRDAWSRASDQELATEYGSDAVRAVLALRLPAFPEQVDPMPEPDLPATPGSEPMDVELEEEPRTAFVETCGICGHASAAHAPDGRCLVMLGAYGRGGPCSCPEVAA